MRLANAVKYAAYTDVIKDAQSAGVLESHLNDCVKKSRIIHFQQINQDILALPSKDHIVRLPFDSCLLSFENKVCILAQEVSGVLKENILIEFNMFFETSRGFFIPSWRVFLITNKNGEIIRHETGNLIIKPRNNQDIPEEEIEKASVVSRLALTHLTFINCKNIYLEKVEQANERINKRRISQHKKPLYSYYIANIENKRSSLTPFGKCGRHYRFHFCRGHFKQRKTGRFWWSQQVRGEKKLGSIIKDYKVE